MLRHALLLATYIILLAPPAAARDTYPEKKIGGWRVYGWDESCWMKTEFYDGVEFTYSLDLNPIKSYVQLTSSKWSSIKTDESYVIGLEIDGWTTSKTTTGLPVGPGGDYGISFFLKPEDGAEFPVKLAKGTYLQASVNGRLIGRYNLISNAEAVLELVQCAKAIGSSSATDPFEQPT